MERQFGVAHRDVLAGMSGVEFLQGIIAGSLPAPPMAQTLGIIMTEAEEGRVVFEGAPSEDFQNPMGTTHGGWFGGILDSALGCAVMSRLPAGRIYTTLEYKVNLIRGIPTGCGMRAIATAAHAGRSSAVATADLVGIEDGRLYGQGSTTCLVMSLKT
ncbi:MAG: PaaI family thioesterase [Silicimonas sp.]|nr:PaaI family thioesterase [Silicimonas sp.]